jgi:hypothetical protein
MRGFVPVAILGRRLLLLLDTNRMELLDLDSLSDLSCFLILYF